MANQIDTDHIRPRAMNKTQLAELYKVSRVTFSKWLKPFMLEIGERQHTYIYTPDQVKIIFQKLGEP